MRASFTKPNNLIFICYYILWSLAIIFKNITSCLACYPAITIFITRCTIFGFPRAYCCFACPVLILICTHILLSLLGIINFTLSSSDLMVSKSKSRYICVTSRRVCPSSLRTISTLVPCVIRSIALECLIA